MKKLKQSRAASFVILALIYALAIAIGVVIYYFLPLESWELKLLIADVVATIVVFAFSCILHNASVYDPYWSVQPLAIIVGFAFAVPAIEMIHIILLIAVGFWGIRLTANWAYTFENLDAQDWRYSQLKEEHGKKYPIVNFLGIHLMPTLIVYCCVLPIGYAFNNPVVANVGSYIFAALALCAALMQGIADIQMHMFRKHPNGTFNRNGLWKYSRHPNYLGEILMWWFVALCVFVADVNAWYTLIGALFNTLLFLFTSIPLAENHQARKPGFEEYKAQTRMLLPIYKKQIVKEVEENKTEENAD